MFGGHRLRCACDRKRVGTNSVTGCPPGAEMEVQMRRFSGFRLMAVGSALAFVLALVPVVPASAHSASDSHPNNNQLAANLFTPNLNVFNASCPGETSTSLITGNPSDDNGCQLYREFALLHVWYQGSQFSYAKSYIASNPGTKFVSLMIGGNDLLLLQDGCKAKTPPVNFNACIIQGLPSLLVTLRTNVRTIYAGLRAEGCL